LVTAVVDRAERKHGAAMAFGGCPFKQIKRQSGRRRAAAASATLLRSFVVSG
jgi:hypothetical protein